VRVFIDWLIRTFRSSPSLAVLTAVNLRAPDGC